MWLIHPKPFERELLSSWLLRTSEMTGWNPHSFCHAHWPGLQIWNRDIDKLGPPLLIEGMAAGTGVSISRAKQTTLRALEGVAVEQLASSSDSIITNIGVYHRKRTGFGLRYCPLCFTGSETSYFRMEWRLLAVSTCPRHGVVLQDSCSSCDAPIVPSRGKMTVCHECEAPLSDAAIVQASASSICLDAHTISVLSGAPVSLPFLKEVHPLAYFGLLRRLLLVLTCGPRRTHLWEVLNQCGVPVGEPSFSRANSGIRFLRVSSVHELGPAVSFLLRGWPTMMVGVFAEAGIWKSWALRDGVSADLPFCYEQPVRWFLSTSSSPRLGR